MSLLPIFACESLDARQPYGMRELNPLLAAIIR
jgi:hypothetical protein